MENGREPTVSEIASEAGMSNAEVAEALGAGGIQTSSLDSGENVLDRYEAQGWGSEVEMINRLAINDSIQRLKGKERQIVVMRYICGQTQQKVAESLGLSQANICRIEKKIRQQLADCI